MMHEQPARCDLRFASLPPAARAYVVAVIAAGAAAAAARFPTQIDRPILFGLLLVFGWLTSTWCAVVAAYFALSTAVVALAIALARRRPGWTVWRDNFLWSAPSFMVAGGAGALAAVVIARGDYWVAPLILAPVYLTYRTYKVFLASQVAERALRLEKERLAVTLRSIGDGVIATDTHGLVRIMNPAAE